MLATVGAGAAGVGLLAALVLRSPPKAANIQKAAVENSPDTLSEYPAGRKVKTTDGTECLPIRTGREGMSKIPSVTLHDLFRELLDREMERNRELDRSTNRWKKIQNTFRGGLTKLARGLL